MIFFFFFKQKTAYEMRISDWSSDVCSSDLAATQIQLANQIIARRLSVREAEKLVAKTAKEAESATSPRKKANGVSRDLTRLEEIGRASCRARVCQYG